MACKICGSRTEVAFEKLVLNKYPVQYHRCTSCSFMQTDEPVWLAEAYEDAINETDIGLVSRNKLFSELVTAQLSLLGYDRRQRFLDYGGGYGMFVRMMRDSGYNFFSYDQYCDNLYSDKFVDPDPGISKFRYEAITAFEVFEHLTDPIHELEKLLARTDTILFSTELSSTCRGSLKDWWYVMPEHGQHIAFYHVDTLKYIAGKYGLRLYTNGHTLHMLTRKRLSSLTYRMSSSYKFARLYNTFFQAKSLLAEDYNLYLKDSN